MKKNINLLELESLRSELIEKTLNTSSNNLRLFLYQNYFEKILYLNNPNFEEAFLKEFLDDYTSYICKFEAWGVEPYITKEILEQLKQVALLKITSDNLNTLNSETDRIQKQLEKQNLILDGKDFENDETHKAFFPLIDKEAPTGFYGIIESVTVRINKAVDEDKFIIIPSEKEIEKKILEQCKKSWIVAFDLSRAYIKKPFKHHEVIISFDKKQGFYEGNSLGIALTLSFLEQILKVYNPAYIIYIKEHSAFTGGTTETGEVLCTSEDIIKRKVAAVFFSEINTFVFPKREETYAYFALTQLKKSYPIRKLKLIPVEDINDVLNRRDVVDIKKQKVAVRTAKFVKRNWISAAATVLLAILFAYLFVMDFDDNPAKLSTDARTLFVKNKNNKILWEKDIEQLNYNHSNLNYVARIIDIDDDGTAEVLLTNEIDNNKSAIIDYNFIRCYTASGKIIWKYSFKEEVYSWREKLSTEYVIRLIDTLTYNGKKSLFLAASNGPSFSSAIHGIDLKTGEPLTGIFWTSGHTSGGIISDIDNDGNPEMIGLGFDNGYEDVVLFAYEIDSKNKVRPTTEEYLIRNYQTSQMKVYLRFPKTDYDNYYNQRTPRLDNEIPYYDHNENEYRFNINNIHDNKSSCISFHISSNFKEVTPFIESGFRVLRDSLVVQGKLKLPYTDTEEYRNIIKSNILYWKNGKWVKRDEVD